MHSSPKGDAVLKRLGTPDEATAVSIYRIGLTASSMSHRSRDNSVPRFNACLCANYVFSVINKDFPTLISYNDQVCDKVEQNK